MSPIKETAIRMIQEMTDDKIEHVLYILRGINGLYKDQVSPADSRRDALMHMQKFRGRIPSDMDYDKELEVSRAERYANIN